MLNPYTSPISLTLAAKGMYETHQRLKAQREQDFVAYLNEQPEGTATEANFYGFIRDFLDKRYPWHYNEVYWGGRQNFEDQRATFLTKGTDILIAHLAEARRLWT